MTHHAPATRAPWTSARHLAVAFAATALATAALTGPALAAPVPPGEDPIGATIPDDWPGNTENPHGGTDYHLDATTGDDSADGTSPETAWQTLERANDTTFGPGDRVLLKAGEEWHDQQLWPKGSGAEGQPISIDAYGEAGERRPYIAANGNVDSPFRADGTRDPETVGLTGAVVLRNQEYWEIANLELSNDDDFADDITETEVVRDGLSITINADQFEPGTAREDMIMNHFRISDLYVHHIDGPSFWQQIHYGGINFQVFGEHEYETYEEGAYYFQDVRIENNTFDNVELHAIQFAFNWFYDRDPEHGQYDEDGKWHEGWEQLWVRERDLYSRDVYIANNYAQDVGKRAIQLANTKDMLVEYNEVNGFLQRYDEVSAGLYLWAGADSVKRFNQVYGGPYAEFDGTPWDLEFTNFDVTYEFNYSHDNAAGWMSYMGNSSNSIARYNLSVNDNGVVVHNMLSTNYSPTYFANNVFVYDAEYMDYFHDETFIDTVYWINNVFYNTSETRTTPWYRRDDALRLAVFSNNVFYEASGEYSDQQPVDERGLVDVDPGFVGDVADYGVGLGVHAMRDAAAPFRLAEDSPLIDAGRYNDALGPVDFFGTPVYYGDAPDIGIHEVEQGGQVTDPVDEDPIEDEHDQRLNLALGQPITATSTHPDHGDRHGPERMVDGHGSTRWAAADDAELPVEIEIDFEEATTFDEVSIDEYTDSGTDPRVAEFQLQHLTDGEWVTFHEGQDGIGREHTVDGFGEITSRALRITLDSLLEDQVNGPTIAEIRVYGPDSDTGEVHPELREDVGVYDLNSAVRESENNSVSYGLDLDGGELTALRYIGTEGNVLASLTEGDDYTVEPGEVPRYVLTTDWLLDRSTGDQGLRFEVAGADPVDAELVVVDSTELEEQLEAAAQVEPADSPEYAELAAAVSAADEVLALANRDVPGTGNDRIRQPDLDTAADDVAAAIAAFEENL